MPISRGFMQSQSSNPDSVSAPWNLGVIWDGIVTASRTRPAEKDGQPTGGEDILVELELLTSVVATPSPSATNKNPQPQQYAAGSTVTLWFSNGARVHALLSACEAVNSDLLEGGRLQAGVVSEKHTGNIQPMKIVACQYSPPAGGLSQATLQANAQPQQGPQQFAQPSQQFTPQPVMQPQPAPAFQQAPQQAPQQFEPQPVANVAQFPQQQPTQAPTLSEMMSAPQNGAPAA